jgi:sRNA-binding regulator protein Hfq
LKEFINMFSNYLLLIATQQSKVTSQKHAITHYIIQGVQKSTLQLNTHHTLQCSTHQ